MAIIAISVKLRIFILAFSFVWICWNMLKIYVGQITIKWNGKYLCHQLNMTSWLAKILKLQIIMLKTEFACRNCGKVMCQLWWRAGSLPEPEPGLMLMFTSPHFTHFYRRELWRALVIQLLGGRFCWMAWGGESWWSLVHVELVSALRLASTWTHLGSQEGSGWLRRGVQGQGGNSAAKSPRVSQ